MYVQSIIILNEEQCIFKMKIKIYSPHKRAGIGDYTDSLYEELLKLNPTIQIISNNNPLTPNPFYFIKAALQSKCDALHVQFNIDLFGKLWRINGLYIYLYYVLAKLMRPKIITTIHDIPDITAYGLFSRWYVRMLHLPVFMLSKYVIVHTEEAKKRLTKYGLSSNKIQIVPIGINTHVLLKDSSICKKQLNLSGKKVLFLWGFVRQSKQYEEVIRSLPYLDKKIVLLIAGPVRPGCKEYLIYLKTLVNKLYLNERVIFDNRTIPEEIVHVYFGASDIAVFPYNEITQSAALSQALSYRKLILTSDIPPFIDIKNKWNCIETYSLGNQTMLISKIKLLLKQKSLQQKLTSNINRILKETNWAQIAKKTYSVYITAASFGK